jgi:CDP-glucose 4,6-dehydratase
MSFWQEKTVFITGHTGFKGSWLSLYLQELGANVFGYALEPEPKSLFAAAKLNNEFESVFGDIRDFALLESSIKKIQPEIIFHLAAQSLVGASYQSPLETIEVNVLGSSNLLIAAQNISSVKAVVNVTSDKCYENSDFGKSFCETDRLGGIDPYSASKACVEIINNSISKSFYKKNNIGLASARAGNVIGGGDWGIGRLVPEVLNAIEASKSVKLRYPGAFRPWQHVMEPLSGYALLAQNVFKNPEFFSEPYNFGPNKENIVSVETLVSYLYTEFNLKTNWIADERHLHHEAVKLDLNSSKAKSRLLWSPKWSLNKTVSSIVEWHTGYNSGLNMNKITKNQISQFINSDKLVNEKPSTDALES